jgi:hypothetical protein
MTISSDLSKIVLPFLEQFKGQQQLIVGEIAKTACQGLQDSRSQALATPFTLSQFDSLAPLIDVAIISDIVENLPQQQAIQWLSKLRNQYAQHILIIVNESKSSEQGWTLTDYLALGLKHRGHVDIFTLYTYEIENYQFEKDWLNNRYWANPENFHKYRW